MSDQIELTTVDILLAVAVDDVAALETVGHKLFLDYRRRIPFARCIALYILRLRPLTDDEKVKIADRLFNCIIKTTRSGRHEELLISIGHTLNKMDPERFK